LPTIFLIAIKLGIILKASKARETYDVRCFDDFTFLGQSKSTRKMFSNVIGHCQNLVEVDGHRMLLLRHRLQFLGPFAKIFEQGLLAL
jgi:hypothetical protein